MTHADPGSYSGPLPIQPPRQGGSIWGRAYVWTTAGAIALVFLAAIQSLAVTTVMPAVADDLDGHALYAVAFSGMFATSVVGMVVAGAWSDRRGPVWPLLLATAAFVAGLVIDAAAGSMEVLVAGRLVMGLGSGGQIVSLYVVVARVFPANLHGRVMGAFSAAWVVPSLVGPALAGAVTEFFHWRWVFGGVAALAVVAIAMLAPALRRLGAGAPGEKTGGIGRRVGLAIAVAAGALVLSIAGEGAGESAGPGLAGVLVAVVALAVVLLAMRPLLPRGAYRLGRGLPSVIVARGLVAGSVFGAEIYVPYLLREQYGFGPTWAGLGLTVSALTWAVSANFVGARGDRLGNARIAVGGAALLILACAIVGASAVLDVPAWVPILSWGFAGLGAGAVYPRLTVLSLAYSTRQNQGFNSAALQIADAVGTASTMAIMGLVFVALGGMTSAGAFVAMFALAAGLAALSVVPGLRLGHAAELRG
ncbi:MFS transporter [Microbacterium excoecariae]|uniref:MFS transporter n=1 Tax=Microbacterium excoecariae TaxID=2715210 RepID=UPI0014095B4D